MNDMAFLCEVAISHAGGLAHCGAGELNQALHRNVNSSRAYRPPVELARALFAPIFNSPARPVNGAEDKAGSQSACRSWPRAGRGGGRRGATGPFG
jgi:hypothetical protein